MKNLHSYLVTVLSLISLYFFVSISDIKHDNLVASITFYLLVTIKLLVTLVLIRIQFPIIKYDSHNGNKDLYGKSMVSKISDILNGVFFLSSLLVVGYDIPEALIASSILVIVYLIITNFLYKSNRPKQLKDLIGPLSFLVAISTIAIGTFSIITNLNLPKTHSITQWNLSLFLVPVILFSFILLNKKNVNSA